jgi:azurin
MNKVRHMVLMILIAIGMISCGESFDQVIDIESLGNQMKYNVVQIKAKPNTKILLKFYNNASMDIMKHNIIVLNDESKVDEVGIAALKAPNNTPDHPSIIAASDLIGPGESTELVVNIPSEPGVYPYICTFPGHYQVMRGKIIVE